MCSACSKATWQFQTNKNVYLEGEWSDAMTAKIPLKDIERSEFSVGQAVQLSNGTTATVRDITNEDLVLDMNHSLAGKDLTFEVELVKLVKVDHTSLGLFMVCVRAC